MDPICKYPTSTFKKNGEVTNISLNTSESELETYFIVKMYFIPSYYYVCVTELNEISRPNKPKYAVSL